MLSLIICSKHPKTDSALQRNISETIGTDYEIVHIDNSHGDYNIFQAYNLGVSRSHGEILCFMHEDIKYLSRKWGVTVQALMAPGYVGAIGVAGSNIVTRRSDWRFYIGEMSLVQGMYTVEPHPIYYNKQPETPYFHSLHQMAVLDGAWFCIKREMFDSIRFDEDTFHDFHLYDTDISMQVNMAGKGVFLTYDILIEHSSPGTFTEGYKKSLEMFLKKWDKVLPYSIGATYTDEQIARFESTEILLDKRIEEDKVLMALRQYFQQRSDGDALRPYTEEEKKLIYDTAFRYRVKAFKDKNISKAEARHLLSEYLKADGFPKKNSLRMKYFWHSLLGIGRR